MMSVRVKRPDRQIKSIKCKASDRQSSDKYSDLATLFSSASNKETVLTSNHCIVSPYNPGGGQSFRPASGSYSRKLTNQSAFIIKASKTPRIGFFVGSTKAQSTSKPEVSSQATPSPPKRSQKLNLKMSPFQFKSKASPIETANQNSQDQRSWVPGSLSQSWNNATASPEMRDSKFTFRHLTRTEEQDCIESNRDASVARVGQGYKIRWFDNSFCPVQQQLSFGSLLGEGGFAQVFEAFDYKLAQTVAVKVFDKRKLQDSTKRKEVQNELEFLERIRHPRVVRLLRIVEDQSRVMFVLENWGFESLKDFARRVGHGPELAGVLQRLAEALAFLHSHGIFHRDIKMANVMIRDCQPCLVDFGMACAASGWKEYLYCGTSNYLSPEMVGRSGYFGGPNDVWAFGVLVFRATTGVYPFGGRLS